MATVNLARTERLSIDVATLRDINAENERRTVASRQLELVDHEGTEFMVGEIFAPGSITLMFARRGSKPFAAAIEALKKSGRLDRASEAAIAKSYKGRRTVPLSDAVDLMSEQPTIAELAGGRFTLATNLFVPDDMELALLAFPWNGGSLVGVPFTFTEKSLPGAGTGLDAILVRRTPRLTPAETAALKLVPKAAFDLNIGNSGMCFAITVVIAAAAVVAATSLCRKGFPEFHLDDIAIKELGPELTARALVGMRRQMLERRF